TLNRAPALKAAQIIALIVADVPAIIVATGALEIRLGSVNYFNKFIERPPILLRDDLGEEVDDGFAGDDGIIGPACWLRVQAGDMPQVAVEQAFLPGFCQPAHLGGPWLGQPAACLCPAREGFAGFDLDQL